MNFRIADFSSSEIAILPCEWEKIIDDNGLYIN